MERETILAKLAMQKNDLNKKCEERFDKGMLICIHTHEMSSFEL